jgi:integrase
MPELTVRQIVRAYVDFLEKCLAKGELTTRSVAQRYHYLDAFVGQFGAQLVKDCNRGDIRRFLTEHPEYKSPHTLHGAAGIIVAAFNWAEEFGLVERSPYPRRPRNLPTPQPRKPITREELRQILDHAREGGYRRTCERFRAALWFLFETGCRPDELYRLDWTHYDPRHGVFELDSKTTKKTGRSRLIVLSARAWRLVGWLRRHDPRPVGPVFYNAQGRAWSKSTFGKLFRKHADAAGVRADVSAYSARHGFCCESLQAGVGERQLADLMGHTSTRFIAWYGRGIATNIDYLRTSTERRSSYWGAAR